MIGEFRQGGDIKIAVTTKANRSAIMQDAPRQLVTWGAYKYVRHPFYASFLLAYAGACLLYPHPAVLAFCAYSAAVLNLTAAKEERRLAASEFGDEYRAYMARTGRFFPRWNRTP